MCLSDETLKAVGPFHLVAGVVEAITTDSWCLLCVDTLGADTSWPVSVNSL